MTTWKGQHTLTYARTALSHNELHRVFRMVIVMMMMMIVMKKKTTTQMHRRESNHSCNITFRDYTEIDHWRGV